MTLLFMVTVVVAVCVSETLRSNNDMNLRVK
jgi:hypothetical protein